MFSTPGCSLQGTNAKPVCYLPRQLETGVPSSPQIFALSVWPETFSEQLDPPPDPYCKFVFLSQYIEPIFTDFTEIQCSRV